MKSPTLVVTGGYGFIGSHLLHSLLRHPHFSDFHIINIDKCTYAANPQFLQSFVSEADIAKRYSFHREDIVDKIILQKIFSEHDVKGIIHLAAESHVDNSISGPEAFIRTNIEGTFQLLEATRQYAPRARFLHVSTDEVYGSLGPTGLFTETTPYAPNSPYSASKASSDFLVRCYHHTYQLDTVTTNCSNNYGPNQHQEKLIPTVIRHALAGSPIPIYGKGNNIRDWLFVEDHARGLLAAFLNGKSGETYNLGTENEMDNLSIVKWICQELDLLRPKKSGQYCDQISFVTDRAGHDFRYAIDPRKARQELDWTAQTSFKEGIKQTIQWYLNL
jgi:dTDP-glucose 4,6-dehydratase